MKQELLKGGTDELVLGLVDHGRAVVPSSCSIRILNQGTILESGTATGGRYTPSSAVVGVVNQDLTVEWTYSVSGGPTQRRVELIDVVLFKLYPVISDIDLVREVSALAAGDYLYHGIVESSAAEGFIDRDLIGAREDWIGAIIHMQSGADAGSQYQVSAFDPTTGTVTYAPSQAAAPGDTFTMRRSFQGEIDSAWADIYDKLIQQCSNSPEAQRAPFVSTWPRASGMRPYLVMTPDRLRRPHLLRSLEKIFRGIATDTSGTDWARAEYYSKEFESAWNGLRLAFASDLSTVPVKESEGSAQFGFGR